MPETERLSIPKLTSASSTRWIVATGVAVAAVMVYGFLTDPANRWAVLVVAPLFALYAAFLLARRTWVETATGEVVVHRMGILTRRVPIAAAEKLDLVTNRGGGLLLQVKPSGRASAYLPVLALTDYVERSQSAETLVGLAEQIERWAPHRGTVAKQLRRQAEHVAAGGAARTSPLAGLVSHKFSNLAKGGGAASGTSLLD